MYWAEALANQDKDIDLKNKFSLIFERFILNEDKILNELDYAQGTPVDLNGYYLVDDKLVFEQMRPSETFNSIINNIIPLVYKCI
jgi:isocitrate dehydrogenase